VKSSERYVVDTSVIVTYIAENLPGRDRVVELFEGASRRGVELYATCQTLSEVIYVASRIYGAAGVEEPNKRALDFTLWFMSIAKIVDVTPEMAFRAGELRKAFRISLADCYVIAAAEHLNAKALFLKPEKEMLAKIDMIKNLPILFLIPYID